LLLAAEGGVSEHLVQYGERGEGGGGHSGGFEAEPRCYGTWINRLRCACPYTARRTENKTGRVEDGSHETSAHAVPGRHAGLGLRQ
jgi:hypothetical protein